MNGLGSELSSYCSLISVRVVMCECNCARNISGGLSVTSSVIFSVIRIDPAQRVVGNAYPKYKLWLRARSGQSERHSRYDEMQQADQSQTLVHCKLHFSSLIGWRLNVPRWISNIVRRSMSDTTQFIILTMNETIT